MAVDIQWIHHASFRLSTDSCVVYVDPWKLTGRPCDADVIFISHSHYDHCSPEDVEKIRNASTAIVAPADAIAQLETNGNVITPGKTVTPGEVTIEAVPAYNIDKTFHPRNNHWCGAVFTLAGMRIYYAGDTDLIPEMRNLGNIGVALLPVGGKYTLNADEAVRACADIGCRKAIPCHWGNIVGSEADAKSFAAGAPCETIVLQPGQTTTIDNKP